MIGLYTHGIYLDNYSSNCLVYGNIVARVSGGGILVHSGKNHVIENNVLVDNGWGIRYQEAFAPLGRGFLAGHCFRRNIVSFGKPQTALFFLANWTDRVVAKSDDNLFFKPGGGEDSFAINGEDPTPVPSLRQWRQLGYNVHSLVADPLFVDAEHNDYRLKPESPA